MLHFCRLVVMRLSQSLSLAHHCQSRLLCRSASGRPRWLRFVRLAVIICEHEQFFIHGLYMLLQRLTPPNKSLEPTAVGAVSSAVAVHVVSRRWLSFLR